MLELSLPANAGNPRLSLLDHPLSRVMTHLLCRIACAYIAPVKETCMGQLVDGVWQDDLERHKDGHYVRATTSFRNWVTADGSAGPSGQGGFKAERGRYHLYVSLACPWASRTIIFRKLKKLEDV